MDMFLGGAFPGQGLTDIALRLGYPVNDTMWVKVDAHMMATTEEYADGMSSLGNEIDLTLVKKSGEMTITGGVSMFLPSEDWAGEGAETSKWAYVQSSFGF